MQLGEGSIFGVSVYFTRTKVFSPFLMLIQQSLTDLYKDQQGYIRPAPSEWHVDCVVIIKTHSMCKLNDPSKRLGRARSGRGK
jgi:hypothetical protein